jgi:hypothetical protein
MITLHREIVIIKKVIFELKVLINLEKSTYGGSIYIESLQSCSINKKIWREKMKIQYSKPALNERYLISKTKAKAIAKELVPELPKLKFQTRRGPNMSKDILYLAVLSRWDINILSVKNEFVSSNVVKLFQKLVWK